MMTIMTPWLKSVALMAQLSLSPAPQFGVAKIALVYQGPGACEEGCVPAAADVATRAGLKVLLVGPTETDSHLFDNAAVWIQPGGKSSQVSKAMSDALKERIRAFVSGGGAYVGFCAGGFFSTSEIRNDGVRGLGLVPGKSLPFESPHDADILAVDWRTRARQMYFEGGPYFDVPAEDLQSGRVRVMSTYADGKIAALVTHFGQGRVSVTGLHPEAPQYWRDYYKITDTDGVDFDQAQDMMNDVL